MTGFAAAAGRIAAYLAGVLAIASFQAVVARFAILAASDEVGRGGASSVWFIAIAVVQLVLALASLVGTADLVRIGETSTQSHALAHVGAAALVWAFPGAVLLLCMAMRSGAPVALACLVVSIAVATTLAELHNRTSMSPMIPSPGRAIASTLAAFMHAG